MAGLRRCFVQMARNLTDAFDAFLRNKRHLIHDRDPLFTRVFGEVLKSRGVQPNQASTEKPESERLRGAVHAVHQRGVSQPRRAGAKATCDW